MQFKVSCRHSLKTNEDDKALVGFLGVLCFLFTHDGACISRQLPTHELGIDTSLRHQFIMGALLHNEALVNYTNLGGVDDGTQTVSNQNHCTWWLHPRWTGKFPPKKKVHLVWLPKQICFPEE